MTTAKCLLCKRNDVHDGYRCRDCHNRLVRLLRELEVYAIQLLPLLTEPVRGQTGRMQPGYGSKPPARVEVIAMLDPRTLPDGEHEVRSIPGVIASWADMVAVERDEVRPGGTLTADLAYLRLNLWWCGQRTWVDDLMDEVRELHRQARQLAGDAPPKALGKCLLVTCEGQVHEGGPGKPARCSVCRRPYDGLDLVRLGAAEEAA